LGLYNKLREKNKLSLFGGVSDHFGLDIGTNAIRVVQLRGGGSTFTLESLGSVEVTGNILLSDSKIDLQATAKKIKELIRDAGITSKNVVAAIPGTSVYSTVVKLPPMSTTELTKAIEYQANQNLPAKIDQLKYDWQIIEEDPNTKENTVMIIAAPRGKVEKLVELFGYAELNLVALETAAVAMARSLVSTDATANMILDIGATTTEIAIVENGILKQTRSFPLAGIALTRSIAKNLNLDETQAELFKGKFGLSQDKLEGQVFRAINPVMNNIVEEINRSVKYFNQVFGKNVLRIVITGGSSRLPLLSEYLKHTTGLEVVFGNPWSKINVPTKTSEQVNQVAPEFSTVVGLAMR
jgi:type IV pilus assembly protein PilM